MPVRRELRKFFRSKEWKAIRSLILERAQHRCEKCGVPNYTEIRRCGGAWFEQSATWEAGVNRRWRGADGSIIGKIRGWPKRGTMRLVWIVLAIAHLDHDDANNDPLNLKAFCQWCHLEYDREHHRESRGTRKDQGRPLLTDQSIAV